MCNDASLKKWHLLSIMKILITHAVSVFVKRRQLAKKPSTLPSVPATLTDLSIRLYYKAVILASFLAMSAGYSMILDLKSLESSLELSNFIWPFLRPYMGVIPNPKMVFIFPISCIFALVFPIVIKYFPICEGKGSFLKSQIKSLELVLISRDTD